jgi:hypothetical protein
METTSLGSRCQFGPCLLPVSVRRLRQEGPWLQGASGVTRPGVYFTARTAPSFIWDTTSGTRSPRCRVPGHRLPPHQRSHAGRQFLAGGRTQNRTMHDTQALCSSMARVAEGGKRASSTLMLEPRGPGAHPSDTITTFSIPRGAGKL